MNKKIVVAALTTVLFIGTVVYAKQSAEYYTTGKPKQTKTLEYDVCSEKALEAYRHVQIVRTGEGEGEGETLKYKVSVYEVMKGWCASKLQK